MTPIYYIGGPNVIPVARLHVCCQLGLQHMGPPITKEFSKPSAWKISFYLPEKYWYGINDIDAEPCKNLSPKTVTIQHIAHYSDVIMSQYTMIHNKTTSHTTQQRQIHYSDVIMNAIASQTTGVSNICSAVCSEADQRKHQSSASLAFLRGIHRWPEDSPHKGPITRKMFDLMASSCKICTWFYYAFWVVLISVIGWFI